jgi:hypothetical protein
MANPGDFLKTEGKQRAVWTQPGGHVLVGAVAEHFEALVIEAGTVVREDFVILNDDLKRLKLVVPIMVVPAGATVVKTVAMASLATISWNDSADAAIWGVDAVEVEEDTSTRQLSLVAHIAEGGTEASLPRIAYHITIFIQGRKYIGDPSKLQELEQA